MSFSTVVSTVLMLLLLLLAWTGWGQWRLRQQHPPVGDFVTVDGVRLHYVIAGQGPGIVLVHGASSNLREFTSSLLPALASRYRVVAFDRPGFGYSERPAEGEWLDPGRQADLLLRAAAELGLERPLLVGHSWAGAVVMSALVRQGEAIAGGVSLSGVAGHWAGPLNWTYRLGEVPLLGPLFAWTLVYPLGQFLLERGLGEVFAPHTPPAGQVERAAVALALRPATFRHNVHDMNRSNEYLQLLSPAYDRIDKPLLLIHGEDDLLVPFWNHGRRLLPVVPQVEALLLPATGHAPHHTHTDDVVSAIDHFYQRLLSGT